MLYGKMLSRLVFPKSTFLKASMPNTVGKANIVKLKRQFDPTWNYYENPEVQEERRKIYYLDEVETGPKELKVILTEDSEDFGVRGEVVILPKHFSRRLIGQNKAVYASPENMEEYATMSKKTSQTLSGRRLMLWLKRQGSFNCPYRYDAKWTLTEENLARCLLREHHLSVPPSALTLPTYEITNENVDPSDVHEIKITINNADTVPVNITISNWEPTT